MRHLGLTLLTGAAVTAAVGLLTADGWPGYVIGAVLALALWVIAFFGAYGTEQRLPQSVPPATYAGAAAFGVALGYAFFRLGDGNGAWWAPAFIMAGVIAPWGRKAADESRDQSRGDSLDRG